MASFRVTDLGGGLIRVDVAARIVNRPLAEGLCAEIESASAAAPATPRILMNLGALSKATPGAGIFALRKLKRLDPAAVAFFRGNAFMRAFARVVMRLAGFRSFALFEDEAAARAWLESAPTGAR